MLVALEYSGGRGGNERKTKKKKRKIIDDTAEGPSREMKRGLFRRWIRREWKKQKKEEKLPERREEHGVAARRCAESELPAAAINWEPPSDTRLQVEPSQRMPAGLVVWRIF